MGDVIIETKLPSVKPSIRRIAWMFDTQSAIDSDQVNRVLGVLGKALHAGGCVIEPIQLKNRSLTYAAVRGLLGGRERARPEPADLRHFSGPGRERFEMLPTRTFDWEGSSEQALCYYLSCYLQLTHTDVLVAPDGLRRGLFHKVRSGFASALSMESKVPVLVIGSEYHAAARVRNILFPVFEPKKSAEAFRNLLEFSKISDAKITILYRHAKGFDEGLWDPIDLLQVGAIQFYEPALMLRENSRLRIISSWINEAKKEGVFVELKQNKSLLGFTAAILKFQEESRCDLIAVDPSYLEDSRLNHAVKHLARVSHCPIWIPRPVGQSACKEFLGSLRRRLSFS